MNNVYDRMINILLEARVEVLAEAKKLSPKQKKLDVNKSGKLDSQDFKMLRAGKRSDEAKEEQGMSPNVKGAIRQKRFEKDTGSSPANSEAARQKKHHETHGKAAPGRAIKARGKRVV